MPFVVTNTELAVRAPILFVNGIATPTFVFEGAVQPANDAALELLRQKTTNPLVHYFAVRGASHFSILAPTNAAIAKAILADDPAGKCKLDFHADELAAPFAGR